MALSSDQSVLDNWSCVWPLLHNLAHVDYPFSLNKTLLFPLLLYFFHQNNLMSFSSYSLKFLSCLADVDATSTVNTYFCFPFIFFFFSQNKEDIQWYDKTRSKCAFVKKKWRWKKKLLVPLVSILYILQPPSSMAIALSSQSNPLFS